MPGALATHARFPVNVLDTVRLRDTLLGITWTGTVLTFDPRTGKSAKSLKVEPAMLDEPVFSDLQLDEADAVRGGNVAYVAGHFGRPGERAFTGFVLGFDMRLQVTSARKFGHVVQNLAADQEGAVAILTEGTVVDVLSGKTLRKADYERASEGIAVRRIGPDLWIAVGDHGNTFVLAPHGKIVMPSPAALPVTLIPVPDGVAVISQGVDAVYVITSRNLRTVTVPQSGADGVLLGDTLYVLSGGSDVLTAIRFPDLSTATYALPPVSTLLA